MSSIQYRREIDGLRALAIVPVVLFHINPTWVKGGFVGVDIFFVISGYLITSIIIKELNDGTFSFKSFWERRVRRIMPPLFAMVIAVMLIYLALGVPPEATSSLGEQAIRVATFTANHFMNSAAGDYWGSAAESMPLLHTWSLAVEEQFYLFFPLFIFAAWHIGKRFGIAQLMLVSTSLLAVASFVACLFVTHANPSRAFFLLPFRAWELACGAFIAVLLQQQAVGLFIKRKARLSDLGGVIMLASIFLLDGSEFPGWKALVPVVGAGLYVTFSSQGGIAAGILKTRPAVYVGKVSYSLYLWHWPALVLGGLLAAVAEQPWLRFVAFGVSCLLALASYHIVEPMGRATKQLLTWSIACGLTFVTLAAYLKLYAPKASPPFASPTSASGILYESMDVQHQLFQRRTSRRFDGIDIPTPEKVEEGMRPVLTGPSRGQMGMVVLGDSHGMMWSPLLRSICDRYQRRAAFTVASGIPPFLARKRQLRISDQQLADFNKMRMDLIRKTKPSVVVIVARWDAAQSEGDIFCLDGLVRAITQNSPSSKIVLINQPPVIASGDQNMPQWLAWRKRWNLPVDIVPELRSSDWAAARDYLSVYCRNHPDVHLIEIDDLYRVPTGRILAVRGGNLAYTDDDHLSDYGARLAEERIEAVLKPMLMK